MAALLFHIQYITSNKLETMKANNIKVACLLSFYLSQGTVEIILEANTPYHIEDKILFFTFGVKYLASRSLAKCQSVCVRIICFCVFACVE